MSLLVKIGNCLDNCVAVRCFLDFYPVTFLRRLGRLQLVLPCFNSVRCCTHLLRLKLGCLRLRLLTDSLLCKGLEQGACAFLDSNLLILRKLIQSLQKLLFVRLVNWQGLALDD